MLSSVIMQSITVESKVLMVSEEFSLLKYPGEIRVVFKFCRTHCEIYKSMLSIMLKKKSLNTCLYVFCPKSYAEK